MFRQNARSAFFRGRTIASLLFFLILGRQVLTQKVDTGSQATGPSSAAHTPEATNAVLVFKLFSDRTRAPLDRQAVVKLVNLADGSSLWQASDQKSTAVFNGISPGNYEAEVSAAGYLPQKKQVEITTTSQPVEIELVLHQDQSAIDPDVANSIVSPKVRKQVKDAIVQLKSGNLPRAQKHLDQAYKAAPTSAEINSLLGYLYFQKKDFDRAGSYLLTAAKLRPNDNAVAILLGQADLERERFAAATPVLQQAALNDAGNWVTHGLLAYAYLAQQQFEAARAESEVAIAKGSGAANPVRLVLARSLLGLKRYDDATQALRRFIEQSPRHPMATQIRSFLAAEDAPSPNGNAPPQSLISALDLLAAFPSPTLPIAAWQPPGIDDVKLPVAPGISCPISRILEESGRRVEQFAHDVDRFTAIEDLFHQSLDSFGIPTRTTTRKYNYIAAISEPQPGILNIDETRAQKLTLDDYPDQIATKGFAALALVFHPHRRGNFDMVCEGLGDWKGQAVWLVRFQQRNDRPNYMHSYRLGHMTYPVALRGRAWITADQFHIIRIESEIIRPIAEIQLMSEHQIVEYEPVPFPKKDLTLWLPRTVDIYFDFRRRRYYRRHSFDHYMLFSVDSGEKRKEPVLPVAENKTN